MQWVYSLFLLASVLVTPEARAFSTCVAAFSSRPIHFLATGGSQGGFDGILPEGRISTWTDKGEGIKYKKNEDSLGVFRRGDESLMVIADGMGGHGGGEIASRIIVEGLGKLFRKGEKLEDAVDQLGPVLEAGYGEMISKPSKNQEIPDNMGATLVGAWVHKSEIILFHAGDSRAMIIHPDGRLEVTLDHSWVQEKISSGELTPEQAKEHPYRSIVTNALSLDRGKVEEHIVEGHRSNLERDSLVILASDGLWDNLSVERVQEIAKRFNTAPEIAKELRKQVRIMVEKGSGSDDNISIIVYRHGHL